jgi:anti-sigma factor RsiW
MTGSTEPSTTTDQEQLVAYLDGELSHEEAQQVERRLSQDEGFRQLLRSLQQTWDLLDELPQPTLDDGFTQTTVEMVAVRMNEDVAADERRQQRWRRYRRVAQLAAVAAGLLLGFWGVRYLLGRADRELLSDLPVIERVDLYDKIDDLAFLESLSKAGMFTETDNEESPGEQP